MGGKAQTVGVATVNMADHLNAATTSADLQLVMDTSNGVDTAALMVDLSWSFVKEGKPDDEDVASTMSAEDELDDDGSALEMDDDDDYEDGGGGAVDDSPVEMRFAVFLQEEGEDELVITAQPSWTLDEVRDAAADQMDGRGLWVFMSDGAPVDPEEEESMNAEELNLNEGGDDSLAGLMGEEAMEELQKAKEAEKRLQAEVGSLKRMLQKSAEAGGEDQMVQIVRDEMEKLKQEHAQALSEKQAELEQKTTQWQQAMEIGQDLVEKQRELQDELEQAKAIGEQSGAQLEPLQAEIAQLKDIITDHEEQAAAFEEEQQGMEEQRYRINELESVKDMLEQELRDKDDAFEEKLERELDEQKAGLETKHEADIKWEQEKTEKALEAAKAAAAESSKQEASDVEALKSKITELEGERDSVAGQLRMEQSMAGAHKKEIKKGAETIAAAKKEKKELQEKIESAKGDAKKFKEEKEEAEKKRREEEQKNGQLKKDLHQKERELSEKTRECDTVRQELEKKEAELGDREPEPAGGLAGQMDMAQMAQMQAEATAEAKAEMKAKYDQQVATLKKKLADSEKKLKKASSQPKQVRFHTPCPSQSLASAHLDSGRLLRRQADPAAMEATIKAAMEAAQKKAFEQANLSAEKKAAKMEARLKKKEALLREQKKKAALLSGKKPKKVKKAEPLEGHLMKKGNKGIVKKWSWRYFEYKPETHRLNYSEEQKSGQKKYKGFIDLTDPGCKVFVLPNAMQDKCRQSFGIESGGRVYYLMAGDRKMMTKWVGRLQRECKAWQENGGKKPAEPEPEGAADDAEEGVPPEDTAKVNDEMVAATQKANELLAALNEADGSPSADLQRQAGECSDEMLALGKKSIADVDYTKATLALKLAVKLDPENMDAESELKKAVKKMAAMDGELQESLDEQAKREAKKGKAKAAAKKPTPKKISMFDDDEEDDEEGETSIFDD